MQSLYKYIYGPVYSWRLGMSLGIDPLTDKRKICNFDCPYCQLGRTPQFFTKRENFVPTEMILAEIKALPPVTIDHYTFCGRGEPTLALNLGEMIDCVREETKGQIAVITNCGLIDNLDVQKDLAKANWVLAKLDACNQESFEQVNVPANSIAFEKIVKGIKDFKKHFKGKLALQIMFVDQNKKYASEIAQIARSIGADEVQINTPLRPNALAPLSCEELERILVHFKGLPAVSVYDAKRKTVVPLDERATILRHGNFKVKE